MARAEGSFDGDLEAVELLIRDERQCRSCEAAAVDADGSLTRQQLLAQRDCERHVLLFDVAGGGHILQQRPRRHTGLVDVVQEGNGRFSVRAPEAGRACFR